MTTWKSRWIVEVRASCENEIVDSQGRHLCEALNIEPELKVRRLRKTKRQFAYEAAGESVSDALKRLEVTFFSSVMNVTAKEV